MPKTFNEEDVRFLLGIECQRAGSQKAWAELHDLRPTYVNDVLLHKRAPGKAILAALGLRRIVNYVKD
jgi:hypothetical protein